MPHRDRIVFARMPRELAACNTLGILGCDINTAGARNGCEQSNCESIAASSRQAATPVNPPCAATMAKQKSFTKVGLAGGIAGSMEIAVTYPSNT